MVRPISAADYAWTCRCCGKQHRGLPLDYGFDAPDHWMAMSEEERRARGHINPDVCVYSDADGKHVFVRGCLEIPVHGLDDRLVWGVWASVSQPSFERILELWRATVPADEPPRFGWLCNDVSLYPPTVGLKTNLHLRGDNLRPLIELQPAEHPLAIEQREGISIARVEEIAAALLHL